MISSWTRTARRCRRRVAIRSIRLDRKSTRLNSSHSQISYAVFCLKKKKNKPFKHHLSPLAVHGSQHLLGYEHAADSHAAAQTTTDNTVLSRICAPKPYVTRSRKG